MLAKDVVEAVRSVIGTEPAELHEPYIPQKAQEYVTSCLSSGKLSAGVWTRKLEEMICQITGSKYAVATCNGTCALHATLDCLGLKVGTIRIPSLTFVATANAVTHAGMRPHFVEPEQAQIPVDILGMVNPAKGIVRDSAQAFGTKGISGTRIFSFNQNKIVTCSLGGAVVTNDGALAKRIFHRITTARIPHPWLVEHTEVAFNYRMSDINASIGVAQLEEFDMILAAKKKLAEKYQQALGKVVWKAPDGSNHWLTAIMVDNRDEVLDALHKAGYKARCLPRPLHELPMYKNCPKEDLTKTMNIYNRAICLPSSPKLGMKFL